MCLKKKKKEKYFLRVSLSLVGEVNVKSQKSVHSLTIYLCGHAASKFDANYLLYNSCKFQDVGANLNFKWIQ